MPTMRPFENGCDCNTIELSRVVFSRLAPERGAKAKLPHTRLRAGRLHRSERHRQTEVRRHPSSILATSMAARINARIATIQYWNVQPRSVKCCTSQSFTPLPPNYLMSAGPRQPCVLGSRTRPLPQPPTRSRAVTSGMDGIGTDGIPAFITCGSGF
jgi:hypothetical protein